MEAKVREIIKNYLTYGYPLCLLLMQKYPVVETYGEENTRELWAEMSEEMEGEM